jgi:hypothetical protein
MHDFIICLRLIPGRQSIIPHSIFDKLPHNPDLNTSKFKAPSAALGKVPKDHRFGQLRVDWVDMDTSEKRKEINSESSKGKVMQENAYE